MASTLSDDVIASAIDGPRSVQSLRARHSTLAAPAEQLRQLAEVDVEGQALDFEKSIAAAGSAGLHPAPLEIFQINLGKLCNMTCRHCHVDAGPDRTDAMTSLDTV